MTANPTLLSMPLAQNGQKNVIPETQATAGDGLFSQSTGFPAETSLPLGAGGVAPSREDFNGMANLLGGVAYYAQKGFTFNYDATQDYYTGCIVIDPNDGNRYLCIADMAAGTVAPSADTAHTYWIFYPVGVINKRDMIATSGTYTAPVSGWYKITIKGGGGGGGGGYVGISGGGGGEGGTTIAYEYMLLGDTATVVIGAGGAGGTRNTAVGTNGGNSSVTVNSITYTGGGGKGGNTNADRSANGFCLGGGGTINGAAGQCATGTYADSVGAVGGGAGGGIGWTGNYIGADGESGGGGAGGCGSSSISTTGDGGNGGNGFVWFEYFAEV